jgi:adenylate cyclase
MAVAETIAELEIKLPQISDLKERAEMLFKLLKAYNMLSDPEGGKYVDELTQLSKQLHEPVYEGWAVTFSARFASFKGEYENSIRSALKAIPIFEAVGLSVGQSFNFVSIGLNYVNLGNYALALEYYLKALPIQEMNNDRNGMGDSFNNIANIHFYQGNHQQAIDYLLKVVPLRTERVYRLKLGGVYSNIGINYQALGDHAMAMEYLQKGMQIRDEEGDKHGLYNSNLNIGALYDEMGNYEMALKSQMKALKYANELGDAGAISKSNIFLGEIYIALNDFERAQHHISEGLNIAVRNSHANHHRDALKASYKLKKAAGDMATALSYYEQYFEAYKQLSNSDTKQKIAGMQFNFELLKKEKEAEIERLRNVELKKEKELSDALLKNILPSEVAEELKKNGVAEAKLFEDVTVLFTDFQNFTGISEKLTPHGIVTELHECFRAFDEIIGKYNIEKIKTVGDAYLAAAGVPSNNPGHAGDSVRAAIEIRDFMHNRRKRLGDETMEIRIGLHSGKVVAGIVGVKKFAYDIWGDTVNIAARMEQNCEPGKVNISEATYQLVKEEFECKYRGEIEAKNKGRLKMYYVEGSIL